VRLLDQRFPSNLASIRGEDIARAVLTLHFLPGYAPDLNPDELVWSHVKRTGTARRPLQAGEHLDQRIDAELAAVQRNPKLVRSFFKHPSVAYVTDR
jgi:transposase